jgi:hypothetical protein
MSAFDPKRTSANGRPKVYPRLLGVRPVLLTTDVIPLMYVKPGYFQVDTILSRVTSKLARRLHG